MSLIQPCNHLNAKNIDDYIKNNPECRLRKTVPLTLQGKRIDLDVYRLPLNLTCYNIKNGRFAAEYVDLVKNKGRELDATDTQDAKKIQEMLMELDAKQSQILETDMQRNGQKDPGIITHDGFVINGNRRRAILEKIVSDGMPNFAFIEVGRLPPNVSSKDLWKIEAGIQLSHSVQLDYGPINELLKFKEGIDAGLSPNEIAASLYGGFKAKDIENKLVEFKLISEYLYFVGEPGMFNKAKRIHEHFIDLRKILDKFEKDIEPSPDEIVNAKRIGFQLIHDGVQAREFRKLKDILLKSAVRDELWTAVEYSKPEPSKEKMTKKLDAEEDGGHTKARTIFNNCVDSIKALSDSEHPELLLGRALKNLRAIDTDNADLCKAEITSMMDDVDTVMKELRTHSMTPKMPHK